MNSVGAYNKFKSFWLLLKKLIYLPTKRLLKGFLSSVYEI